MDSLHTAIVTMGNNFETLSNAFSTLNSSILTLTGHEQVHLKGEVKQLSEATIDGINVSIKRRLFFCIAIDGHVVYER